MSYSLPPPVAHNVWILDCKSCNSFFTNRAMKAVLLLRPNVPLYSSDALPVNCSAYCSNPDVLKPPASCRPPLHSSRTCECLTQTLCCHGCGATIGYMIVIPCVRCTSSISTTNRATNGHRFVFHSTEVVASKRYYIQDEPGVIPYENASVVLSAPAHYYSPSPDLAHIPLRDPYPYLSHSEYLPTPPIDMADMSPLSSSMPSPVAGSFPSFAHQTRSDTLFTPPGLRPSTLTHDRLSQIPPALIHSQPSIRHRSPSDSDRSFDSPPPPLVSPYSYGMPTEPIDHACIKLKAGDPLYWHHLTRHGEIPGVSDDPRSRKPASSPKQAERHRRRFVEH